MHGSAALQGEGVVQEVDACICCHLQEGKPLQGGGLCEQVPLQVNAAHTKVIQEGCGRNVSNLVVGKANGGERGGQVAKLGLLEAREGIVAEGHVLQAGQGSERLGLEASEVVGIQPQDLQGRQAVQEARWQLGEGIVTEDKELDAFHALGEGILGNGIEAQAIQQDGVPALAGAVAAGEEGLPLSPAALPHHVPGLLHLAGPNAIQVGVIAQRREGGGHVKQGIAASAQRIALQVDGAHLGEHAEGVVRQALQGIEAHVKAAQHREGRGGCS